MLQDPNAVAWFELADTALKIGLGALISGVATYITVKAKHDAESKARRAQTKSALIQEVAVEAETVTDDVLEFIATWMFGDSDDLMNQLSEIGAAISNKLKHMTSAGAKLMLLGSQDADTALVAYMNVIGKLLQSAAQPELPSKSDLEEMKVEFYAHRDAFFSALSKEFLSGQ